MNTYTEKEFNDLKKIYKEKESKGESLEMDDILYIIREYFKDTKSIGETLKKHGEMYDYLIEL